MADLAYPPVVHSRDVAEADRLGLPFAGSGEDDEPSPLHAEFDDELSLLHAELVGYDSYVAGLITQLIDGANQISHPLELDLALRQKLERIVAEGDPPRVRVAKKYLGYLGEIEKLVHMGQAVLGRSTAKRE